VAKRGLLTVQLDAKTGEVIGLAAVDSRMLTATKGSAQAA
jgi:hypothetical protein